MSDCTGFQTERPCILHDATQASLWHRVNMSATYPHFQKCSTQNCLHVIKYSLRRSIFQGTEMLFCVVVYLCEAFPNEENGYSDDLWPILDFPTWNWKTVIPPGPPSTVCVYHLTHFFSIVFGHKVNHYSIIMNRHCDFFFLYFQFMAAMEEVEWE